MQAYKFNTKVSDTGTITLPYNLHLRNTDVEVSVVPVSKNISIEKKSFSANDFISKWKGCIKGMENISDEEIDNIKHEYLKQKHNR
jgi:hypothetical protein